MKTSGDTNAIHETPCIRDHAHFGAYGGSATTVVDRQLEKPVGGADLVPKDLEVLETLNGEVQSTVPIEIDGRRGSTIGGLSQAER